MPICCGNSARRSPIALAIATALSTAVLCQNASADVIEAQWGGVFTMLDPAGSALANSSLTAKGANQFQTPVTGTISFDTGTGAGAATLVPFQFFGGDPTLPAEAVGINLQAIGDGAGGMGSLVLGNMLFNWNGNFGIPVSIVLDAAGFFGGLQGGQIVTGGDLTQAEVAGFGAVPASDGTYTDAVVGYLGLGPVPIATTAWNTSLAPGCTVGNCLAVSPSGGLPLVLDTFANNKDFVANTGAQAGTHDTDGDGFPSVFGIGGNPMADGPFPAFNANFDITSMTMIVIRPSVTDDTGTNTALDTPVAIDVLANDLNGLSPVDPTTVVVASAPGNGSTAVDPVTGVITYSPDPGFTGADSFTYQVSNADGNQSAAATVAVTVGATGGPPVANDDSLSTPEDTALVIDVAAALTANDTDPDMDALSLVSFTQPSPGSLVNNNDGTLTFTPDANFNGQVTFSYTIEDTGFNSATASVTIDVTAVNDPPVAVDNSATTLIDTPVTINVLGNDSDADNDDNDPGNDVALSISAFTQPANGSVAVNGSQLTYTPNTGFTGSDSFTYTVTDGTASDTATVTVTVLSVAFEGPVAEDFQGAGGGEQISPDITGGSSFIMIGGIGQNVGGTNDVQVQWNGEILVGQNEADTRLAPTMQITSAGPTPFFNFFWSTSGVRVFGPGTYRIDTGANERLPVDPVNNINTGGTILEFTVGRSQLGAHMLFDWGQLQPSTPCGLANCAIDVAMVWDINHPWEGPVSGVEPFKATGATFNLTVVDGDGDGFPGNRMADGPFIGFSPNFNLNLNPTFSLPNLSLRATQGSGAVAVAGQGGGNVTVETRNTTGSTGSDGNPRPVNFTYDWSASDQAILDAVSGGTSGNSLVFNPGGLAVAPVTARVTITEAATSLQRTETLTLGVAASSAADGDDDGAPDGVEVTPTQVVADNGLNTRLVSSQGTLRLGTISLEQGAQSGVYQAEVSAALPPDAGVSASCVGGCFDFEVRDIAPGSTVNVVLPLSQAIPADASYRKFLGGKWRNFRTTGTAPNAITGGTLASATGGPGTCPPPGDPAYQPGLNEGDFCVQLTLIDGGLNDDDLLANGIIRDPGGVSGATVAAPTRNFSTGTPSSGSGCTLASHDVRPGQRLDWWLVGAALGLLGWYRRRTQRN